MDRLRVFRAAVGRFAELGDLYDATRDEFLSINAFKEALKNKDILEQDLDSPNVDSIITDSVKEQFEKLDIDKELSLSIMSGLIRVSGPAAYFSQKSSSKTANMTLTYSVLTKYQEVNGVLGKVKIDALHSNKATHIVVGIDWGAKCNIICHYQGSQNEAEMKVAEKLKARMDILKDFLSEKGSQGAGCSLQDVDEATKFSYYTYCDIIDNDKPDTFESALTVARSLSKAVSTKNGGKGVPLTYALISLDHLCKLPIKRESMYSMLASSSIEKCFQTMQAIRHFWHQVDDLVQALNENKDNALSDDFDTANSFLRGFEEEEGVFKSDLARKIIEARSGRQHGLSTIDTILDNNLALFSQKTKIVMEKLQQTLKRLKDANEVKNLPSEKETNILILGETGVGKSTWINANANYFAFETLQDAIDAENMKVFIPSRFSYTTDEGEIVTISVGSENETEIMETGQSATQKVTSYKLCIGENTVNFIDTPGIGDVRGLEQNQKNIKSILSHLSTYDKIHGICILLQPNQSRATAATEFCIVELLTHLHRSAAENVIFCCTHASASFYTPGETQPMLRSLLSQFKAIDVTLSPETIYCFDSEAFRLLARLHNGEQQVSEKEIEICSKSWEKAVNQTKRLLKHIQEVTPHSMQNTINLNNAMKIILELSKPLAETLVSNEENIYLATTKCKELLTSNKATEKSQDQLYLEASYLEPLRLDYPRTVCTDGSCVKHFQVSDGIHRTIYKEPCHNQCQLKGVPSETVNEAQVKKCQVMGSGPSHYCKKFSHKQLTKEQTHATSLANFKDYIQELKGEQKVITNICAQFVCYLKTNAIIPFNDAIDSQLQALISQEKSNLFPNQSTIKNLERIRKGYMEEKLIIDKSMNHIGSGDAEFSLEPSEIEKLTGKLFGLKYNGASSKKMFEKLRGTKAECWSRETGNPKVQK